MAVRADVSTLADTLNEIVYGARRDLAEIAQALIDTPDEIKREAMLESMYGLVSDYGDAAAVESLGWYLALRAESVGLEDGFQPSLPEQLPEDVVQASTRWALGKLMGGEDLDKALTPLDGVLDRLVKKLGRESIVRAADSDPKRPRWARVPHGKTCAWCLMLASRGWVYLDARSAGAARQWHADCDCQIVPAWGDKIPRIVGYDPDALYAQYEAARDAVVARKQGKVAYSPSDAEIASQMKKDLNLESETFVVPEHVRVLWPSELAPLRSKKWMHILKRHGDNGTGHTQFTGLSPDEIAEILLYAVKNSEEVIEESKHQYSCDALVPWYGMVRVGMRQSRASEESGKFEVVSMFPIKR